MSKLIVCISFIYPSLMSSISYFLSRFGGLLGRRGRAGHDDGLPHVEPLHALVGLGRLRVVRAHEAVEDALAIIEVHPRAAEVGQAGLAAVAQLAVGKTFFEERIFYDTITNCSLYGSTKQAKKMAVCV